MTIASLVATLRASLHEATPAANMSILPLFISAVSHTDEWSGLYAPHAASSRFWTGAPDGSACGAPSQHAGPVLHDGFDPAAAVQ